MIAVIITVKAECDEIMYYWKLPTSQLKAPHLSLVIVLKSFFFVQSKSEICYNLIVRLWEFSLLELRNSGSLH